MTATCDEKFTTLHPAGPAACPRHPWPRTIITLVDMNAFFATIEQRDQPDWRGRLMAITNGLQGTCVITCSYEARSQGVKTGIRLPEVR